MTEFEKKKQETVNWVMRYLPDDCFGIYHKFYTNSSLEMESRRIQLSKNLFAQQHIEVDYSVEELFETIHFFLQSKHTFLTFWEQ